MMESMNRYEPKVSIVIPAYHAANYLAEAIDSALAQTYPNIEIIVVNDGSRDDGATAAVARRYGDAIRYFEKENGGSSSALNVGIANMTGEWFSWLSHDDLYVPEKVEKQIEALRSLDIASDERSGHIFFSACDLIDAKGSTIRSSNFRQASRLSEQVEHIPHNGYLIAQPTEYIFHGCSCLIHRDAFTRVGCFDEKLRLLNDLDLWFRLYASGCKVHVLPQALVKGRVHARQVSNSIGYSYHNPEQDLYWNRSLDWLIRHYGAEEELFFGYAKNAYMKTRDAEGDRALQQIQGRFLKKAAMRGSCRLQAKARQTAKALYLKLKEFRN